MATRPISWRSLPPFVRVMLVIMALLLFLGIALGDISVMPGMGRPQKTALYKALEASPTWRLWPCAQSPPYPMGRNQAVQSRSSLEM